jgi:Leucine-rich repeat (LRR) protein
MPRLHFPKCLAWSFAAAFLTACLFESPGKSARVKMVPCQDYACDSATLVAIYKLNHPTRERLPRAHGGRIDTVLYGISDTLPPEIGKLSALRYLSVYPESGHAGTIPPEIGMLSKLENLGITSDSIIRLPKEIGELESLKKLHIYSPLVELPSEIGKLGNLEFLTLFGTKFKQLPPIFGGLPKLWYLGIHDSPMETMPEALCDAKEISHLQMDLTQIGRLPDCLGRMGKLGSLRMHGSNLTTLPESIGDLDSLVTLRVTGSRIDSVPTALTRMEKLSDVSFHLNELTRLPPELITLNLREFDVDSNRLCDVPPDMQSWLVKSSRFTDWKQSQRCP